VKIVGRNAWFVRKYFCSIAAVGFCSIHLTLMSVRHTNCMEHQTNLQLNRYCEGRCSGDQMEKNEMGGHIARMRKGREEVYTGFWWENLREGDHLGCQCLCARLLCVESVVICCLNLLGTVNREKADWIGHLWRGNLLLKHVVEGGIEVTERRGRRRKQLLNELKETKGYCELKEETLDVTVRGTGFGTGCGPVVRQTGE
jgi:hypothetical protein